jgi:hypothetical protein
MKLSPSFCSIIGLFFSISSLSADYRFSDPTPIVKFLKPTEIAETSSGLRGIDCIYVINLDERPEKWAKCKNLLEQYNLKVNRFSGVNGWNLTNEEKEELFGPYPVRMSSGQIGCLLSHISVIKDGYERGFKTIWILEDDIEILGDVDKIPLLLDELTLIDPNWDVFYTDLNSRNAQGYNLALALDPRPDLPLMPLGYLLYRNVVSEDIMSVRLRYGTYSYLVSRNGMKKILDFFTHVFFWRPIDIDLHSIPRILQYSSTKDLITNLSESPSDISSTNTLKRGK